MNVLDPKKHKKEFLSTPSARRATQGTAPDDRQGRISIHALCEEGDLDEVDKYPGASKFLSTPSARRATQTGAWPRRYPVDFYPRPLRGGRQPGGGKHHRRQ